MPIEMLKFKEKIYTAAVKMGQTANDMKPKRNKNESHSQSAQRKEPRKMENCLAISLINWMEVTC